MVGIVVQRYFRTKPLEHRFSLKKLFLLTGMVNQIDCTNDNGYNYG
jgi:hypothetical protein